MKIGDIARVTMFRGQSLSRPMWVKVVHLERMDDPDHKDWFNGLMLFGPKVEHTACRYGQMTGFSRGGAPDVFTTFSPDNLPDEYIADQAEYTLLGRANPND